MKREDIQAFWTKHKAKIILTFLGLVTAVLMLSIGFFRTLLIMLLTGLCFLYGWLIDKFGFSGANKAIADFFKRLFKRS
ncbi:MAG: DUF2273 domain-containing protein [Clostridia bacterium]|nr:DUF2273 domain-containing protein [Clostridia bacterium]MBR6006957.1 DUF2273 domain-containing protein [Clostridia bacterium]